MSAALAKPYPPPTVPAPDPAKLFAHKLRVANFTAALLMLRVAGKP